MRAERSTDHEGQVYGGVLVIQQPDGICWTMRHVDPKAARSARGSRPPTSWPP